MNLCNMKNENIHKRDMYNKVLSVSIYNSPKWEASQQDEHEKPNWVTLIKMNTAQQCK